MVSAGSAGRILIIVQNLPAPFDRRVWLEATSLNQAGYTVSVICPKAKGFNKSFETLEDVDIYRYSLPFDAQGAFGYVAEFAYCFLRTFVKSFRVAIFGKGFDAIHACNPPDTYWLLGLFWRLFKKDFVFDHHDLSPEMYAVKFDKSAGMIHAALMFLEKMTFRTAKVIITTNESHKKIAVERGRQSPDNVFIVRSGPDLERLSVWPADPSWKKGKTHLIAYLGEICVQDGVDHLLRAAQIMRDDLGRNDFHCVVVGGGPHQSAIRQYAQEIGIDDLCTFTGRVSDEDLCRILSSADMAVDPDPKNDWSDKSTMNKIMEYMYFGLPIVAYDLVENARSGESAAVYVGGNSERGLATEISALLDDPDKRGTMSKFGQKRLREQLAWEYSVPNLLAAYALLFGLRDSEEGQR
jgi:glycosyltransferase involved in cell wall biosynthesis